MKTLVTLISTLLISLTINAQTKYEQGMQQAFDLWGKQKNEAASNLFERIAKVEKENWLPYYYASFVTVMSTFNNPDKSKVPAQLQKAQENLNMAKMYSQENPENMVLQALLHTADMMQNPAKKGQTLAPKIEGIYQKALAISPENPRVVVSFADWKIGGARYFKEDTTPYCEALKKGLLLFDTYEQKEPFGPDWGKERAEQQYAECGK